MEKTVFKNAEWICAGAGIQSRIAPIFKKNFCVKSHVKTAEVCICGLGYFEMKINGKLPDDSVLNPAHTQYNKRVLYRKFDVTDFLITGENTVTVELGNGFFNEFGGVWNWKKASWRNEPQLIFILEISYKNGEKEQIVSDGSWLVTLDGNTVFNSIYAGETFDARKKVSVWQNAKLSTATVGEPVLQNSPPIRRTSALKPKKIERKPDGTVIVTSPETVTGWAKIKFKEKKDTEITITYCEQLDENGFARIIGKNQGQNGDWWPDYYIQQDKFISDGTEFEFEPKFSYKGFKYIQIDNVSDITVEDITIYRTSDDLSVTGEFECSCEAVNSLHALMKRTLLNNFQGKPTDTPVWEKNGWLGDFGCGLNSMLYNFDISNFAARFIDTMADCFDEYGTVPVMVPSADWGTDNSPVWNTVFVFACESLIDFYGMNDYVKELYPTLKKFAENDIETLRNNGWVWGIKGLADWVAPNGDSKLPVNPNTSEGAEICGTGYIYGMLKSMERIAEKFGKTEDVTIFEQATENILNAFNEKFYNEEKGIYETNFWQPSGKRKKYRQTSNLVPLYFGIVPEDRKERVVKNLVTEIEKNGYRIDTGCIGTKMILPVLFDNGFYDAAYKILLQEEYPSWCYWLKKGDDCAWESWEDETRSKDHYFLATYDEALFSHIGGIRNIKDGFNRFTVSPCIAKNFGGASVAVNTIKGKIGCKWKENADGSFSVKVNIPDGCTADVILKANEKTITETLSGQSKEYLL